MPFWHSFLQNNIKSLAMSLPLHSSFQSVLLLFQTTLGCRLHFDKAPVRIPISFWSQAMQSAGGGAVSELGTFSRSL